MQVVYHLGVHGTDEDRLVRALLKDRGMLAARGMAVPAPGRYRNLLRETLTPLKGRPASPDIQEMLLDSVTEMDEVARLFFSHDSFLGLPQRAIGATGLYPTAAEKAGALANLFPDAETVFMIALKNPATLIPALLALDRNLDYMTLMAGRSPRDLRWPPVLAAIRKACPKAQLIVWCNEDTPLLWPGILRAAADLPPGTPLAGGRDLLATLLTAEGMRQLDHLAPEAAPNRDPLTLRHDLIGLIERHARAEAFDVEIDLPGWDAGMLTELDAGYDQDMAEAEAMDGVTFLVP